MASQNDDMPPDLEDMSDAVAALTCKSAVPAAADSSGKSKVSRELLSVGKAEISPEVAERLIVNKLSGGKPKTREELEKSEFLTDWGTPEQEVMQKQMIDAAFQAEPSIARGKEIKAAQVTKDFMKGTGVKKGFLLGGPSKKASTKAALSAPEPADGDMIVVLAQANPKSTLRLSEVQDAMSASAPAMQAKLADGKWMTPELLEMISKEPRLVAGMQNPRYMAALNEMMKNPKGVMEKNASDVGLQDFLRTFMGVLGDHFTKLGKIEDEEKVRANAQESASARAGAASLTAVATRTMSSASRPSINPEGILGDQGVSSKEVAAAARDGRLPLDDDLREVLSQASVVETLRDPAIQRAMEDCRLDGSKLRKYLSDPVMRRKFMVLQKAGLIRIE